MSLYDMQKFYYMQFLNTVFRWKKQVIVESMRFLSSSLNIDNIV